MIALVGLFFPVYFKGCDSNYEVNIFPILKVNTNETIQVQPYRLIHCLCNDLYIYDFFIYIELFDSEMKVYMLHKVLTSKRCVLSTYSNLETQKRIYCKYI